MPSKYKDIENCREKIRKYAKQLQAGTDNKNPEQRNQQSTDRYLQDLRWYDHWLDDAGIESPTEVSPAHANEVGLTLAEEYHGTTDLYRWNRIYKFHDWLVRMEYTDSNPYDKWHEDKDEKFGFTKTSEQARQLKEGEKYAVSEAEVRKMEEHVGRNRIRDQLIIRLLWQTGMRRGEAAGLKMDDIDRDEREITIRKQVAKQNKKRIVAYQQSLTGLLREWLDRGYRAEMVASEKHDFLFSGERGAPLSAERINDIVIDAADRAGINRRIYADANAATKDDGERIPNRWLISAHNLRHGFGSYMVNDTDAGLWEVSKAMGHSSVEITERIYVEDDPGAGLDHHHKYGPE